MTTIKINATAGSGKTRKLIETAQGHRDRDGIALSKMTIVSFTKAAARGIGDRIANQGASKTDLEHCHTLHSMCYRLLNLSPKEVAADRLPEFFASVHMPYVAAEKSSPDEWVPEAIDGRAGNALIGFFDWQRNRLLTLPQAFAIYTPPFALEDYWQLRTLVRLQAAYTDWKRQQHLLDYTDFIDYALAQERYPDTQILLGDEMQDLTQLQWKLFRFWESHHTVTYGAGDIDQLLYGFLGAVPDDFLNWEADWLWPLPVNHRCRSAIVRVADRLISRNRKRDPQPILAANPGGSVSTSFDLPQLSRTRKTFVLARAAYQLAPFVHELEEQGLPFTNRRGGGGLHESKELTAFAACETLASGNPVSLEQLDALYSVVQTKTHVVHGGKKKLHERVRSEAEQRYSSPVLLGDLYALGATQALVEGVRQRDPDLIRGIKPRQLAYWRRVVRHHGPQVLFEKEQPIQLGTVHSVKGLEADDVYLVSDMPGAAWEAAHTDPEAERRVQYVALTRAKENVVILEPRTRRYWEEGY